MMKYALRAAAAVIIALAVFIISVPASALSVDPKIITGEFRYFSSQLNEVRTHTYYYSDEYFSDSGKVVNEHLRTMSLDLALTAYGTDESECNVTTLLTEIGFDKNTMSAYQMTGAATEDSLGTVIAHKKTKYGDILVAVVRGIGYGLEWENNFIAGKSGPAKGFSDSADKLAERIKSYESQHGLKGSKLWIMGYSRGGGVTDLVGKYINEHLSEFGISGDDLYAYAFEAPAASDVKTEYANIHDVLNVNDPITMVYPSLWGFTHSGVCEPIISEIPKLKRMKLNYNGGIRVEETGTSTPMTEVEKDFIDLLASTIDRSVFADNSTHFGVLIRTVLTMNILELTLLADYISDSVSSVPKKFSALSIIKLLSESEESSGYKKDADRLCAAVGEALDEHDHSRIFSDAEYPAFRDALTQTVRMFIPAFKKDFSLNHPLETVCTFFGNIGEIVKQHFSDTVLYPAEAQDSYYKPESISAAVITIDEKTAEVTSVRIGSRELAPGLDYTLRYKDANGNYTEPDRSGVYTAVVSGMGSYTGNAEKVFTAKFAHQHHWEFRSYGDTVVVMCTEPGCKKYGTKKEYPVRLAVESKEYDGEPVQGGFELSDNFPSEITLCRIDLNYGGTVSEPSAVGRYRAYAELYVTESPGTRASVFCDYNIRRISAAYDKLTIFAAEDIPSDAEVFYGGKKLTELNDYVISFTDKSGNEIAPPSSPGEYNIVWDGRGVYSGKVIKPFVLRGRSAQNVAVFPVILAVIISSVAVGITIIVAVIICVKQRKIQR